MKNSRRRRLVRWRLVLCMVAGLAGRLRAGTFPVTSTGDSADPLSGTLRAAILNANSTPGIDNIVFAIPGSGVQTIQLLSPLPSITEGVLIDGYSQPGASPNTNPPGQGFNTVLMIEVRGAGTGAPCFIYSAASGHVLGLGIQGLVIGNCLSAVHLTAGADHVQVSGNFIGVDATGSTGFNGTGSNIGKGILIDGASSIQILSNLVSGADSNGIEVANASSFVTVASNLIGTNAAGTMAIPNLDGISIGCSSLLASVTIGDGNVVSGNGGGIIGGCGESIQGNFIGTNAGGTKPLGNTGPGIELDGPATVIGNVIAANGAEGLNSFGSQAGTVIQGNLIGTDAAATIDLGNGGTGITTNAYVTIGGTGPGEGNVIAHNGHRRPSNQPMAGGGVLAENLGINIRGNRIFDNWPLGIDVAQFTEGVPFPNDPGDGDFSGNPLQNFPLITSVVPGASTTHIAGSLNSVALKTFDIDLFADSVCRRSPHDYLQGETYLGSLQVTTDGFGNAAFAADVPVVLAAGQPVTATATDRNDGGNTSEFTCPRIVFTVDPLSGPAAGGTTATIHGMLFEPGATVAVGGVPASNVMPIDPETITAIMPALPAGTAHDVTVHNPSGLTGTLESGWVADFVDAAPPSFVPFIATLLVNGVTTGCSPGAYCPADPVTRSQMAVFLLRGEHGVCFTPPPATGAVFADVPAGAFAAAWIERLYAQGITGGCGTNPLRYCPADPVTRAQMAVFLLLGEHGLGYTPPPAVGTVFADVPANAFAAAWIERLYAEGITGGCGTNPLRYCPGASITRGQMAVFLTTAFQLP